MYIYTLRKQFASKYGILDEPVHVAYFCISLPCFMGQMLAEIKHRGPAGAEGTNMAIGTNTWVHPCTWKWDFCYPLCCTPCGE